MYKNLFIDKIRILMFSKAFKIIFLLSNGITLYWIKIAINKDKFKLTKPNLALKSWPPKILPITKPAKDIEFANSKFVENQTPLFNNLLIKLKVPKTENNIGMGLARDRYNERTLKDFCDISERNMLIINLG